MAGGAAAGFAAAAEHALAEVRSGALAGGPAWAVVLVLSVMGLLLSVRVLLAVVVATAGAVLAGRRPAGAGARRARALAGALAPRLLRPLLLGVLVAGGAVVTATPSMAAATTAGAPVVATSGPVRTTTAETTGPASGSTHDARPAEIGTVTGTGAAARTRDLPSPGWSGLSGAGWTPPAAPARPSPGLELVSSGGAGCRPDGEVVVRRGDTLWDLAARSLGPAASDAEIAAAWPRWWHANHDVIGDDPDLLLPGTRLCAPAAP